MVDSLGDWYARQILDVRAVSLEQKGPFRMYRVVLAVAVLSVCNAVRDQSIAVRGRLLCGTTPAANIRVKLIDTDTGWLGFRAGANR